MERYDFKNKCFKYYLKVTRTFTLNQFGNVDNQKPTPQIDTAEYEIKKRTFELKGITFEILNFVKNNHNHITEISIKINALKEGGFMQTLVTGSAFIFNAMGTSDANLEYKFEF